MEDPRMKITKEALSEYPNCNHKAYLILRGIVGESTAYEHWLHKQDLQYIDAATAYDQAFSILRNWDDEKDDSPYRMTWYQTGPYFAYYYSGRYQDVINLANITLYDPASKFERTLEESLLWRGRAYYMIGDTQSAIDDYRAALQVHVNWFPAVQALQELGVQP